MTKSVNRQHLTRGKGMLAAAGPQARFIVFLIFLLIGYTLLLKIFQKLTGIVELPVFLPIALITLLTYIGVAGALYSHKFVGPVTRIRRTLEHVADGDCSVALRLRESDDPMMQELAKSVTRLCDQNRHAYGSVRETADGLLKEVAALNAGIAQGATGAELRAQAGHVQARQEAFEQALKSLGK